MATLKTYSLNESTVNRFEKLIPAGERSQAVEMLMLEFVNLRSPDKKEQRAERERQRKEAEEKLSRLMAIDKAEAEEAMRVKAINEKKLIEKAKMEAETHFKDTCRKKAKVITNIKFNLDPNLDILPKDFKQRNEYRKFWEDLTQEYILAGNKKEGDKE